VAGRRLFLTAIGVVLVYSLAAYGGGGVGVGIKPLWSVAIITDTQTADDEWIYALVDKLKEERPEIVIHIGDTYFDHADSCAFEAVQDLVCTERGSVEFHLAPGNHDLRGGALKREIRWAATGGSYVLKAGLRTAVQDFGHPWGRDYSRSRQWPAWNPDVVDHAGWQGEAGGILAGSGGETTCRYVFKRGGIRFIVCDPYYSREQKEWLRGVITGADDSSVSIVLHHTHYVGKLRKYFEWLGGWHNVRLVLSGHDHHYHHEEHGGISYITGAGIAKGRRGECDAMILRVYRDYLRLDRYIIPRGLSRPEVTGPEPIWMCRGNFTEYWRPEWPRRRFVMHTKSQVRLGTGGEEASGAESN